MSDRTWIKTKDLIDSELKVNDVKEKSFRRWDPINSTFEFSSEPAKGFSPFWNIELEEGTWSASAAQYSQLLLAAERGGMSDVLGKTFYCTSNGENGKDIRYFFNLITD